MNSTPPYRGRFAPSPSGPLHFGSLVSALCSFLQARSNQGEWLVRIEDIDPPREIAGASDLILQALEVYGLHWDSEVCYQSQRIGIYKEYLQQLIDAGNSINCDCTRAMIKESGGIYSGFCIDRKLVPSANTSTRFKPVSPITSFYDQLLGKVTFSANEIEQNFVLKRKDGLFAYQLAVVIDDWKQGITEVVRGVDLLDSTPKQLQLFQSFQIVPPEFFHHPVVIGRHQLKLSKQNKATAIDLVNPVPTLIKALSFLGQELPENPDHASVEELLDSATKNWNGSLIPNSSLEFRNASKTR